MRITNLKVDLFAWHSEVWTTGGSTFGGATQLGVVSVETDAGITGNAFLGSSHLSGHYLAGPLVDYLKPVVMGQDPQDIGRLWQRLWKKNRQVSIQSIGAIDVCLWDINGKVAGLPIHRLLGTCKDAVPAYSSTAFHETPAQYVEEALRFKDAGWTAHKIHPHGEPASDIEICRAVREALGADFTLMLDAMWAYQYADALRVGRAMEELGYYWYEDPLAEEDIYNYVDLGQKLDIPIMCTEYAPGRFPAMNAWITQRATDILRGDVAVTGGITPLVRQCHLAEGFAMRCEIHHGGNSLNNVANLHVTMAVPNCEFYEFFPCTGANVYGLVRDIEVDAAGMVHAPDEPGLGYPIDWDLVNRDHIATVE